MKAHSNDFNSIASRNILFPSKVAWNSIYEWGWGQFSPRDLRTALELPSSLETSDAACLPMTYVTAAGQHGTDT